MAKKLVDNTLYHFLIGAVSNALPLEFAIRASRSRYPEAMVRLKEIDMEIRAYLLELGASQNEIDIHNLMDYAWDFLQIGLPRVRSHGRIPHPEIFRIRKECAMEIHSKISLKENDLMLPAAKYFRICDLLNGNDIRQLLLDSVDCLRMARDFEKSDRIDFKNFTHIREVRQPIHLHPGVEFAVDFTEAGEPRLFLALKINAITDALDLERQVDEFLYQFALARERQASYRRDVAFRESIQKFLTKEVAGELSGESVVRIDGIAAVLAGLYCGDLHKENGLKLVSAREETQKIYKLSEDAVEKNYKQVNARIKKYIEKFESAVVI